MREHALGLLEAVQRGKIAEFADRLPDLGHFRVMMRQARRLVAAPLENRDEGPVFGFDQSYQCHESGPAGVYDRAGPDHHAERQDRARAYRGQVPFGTEGSGRNLPFGVIVDNLGLNGLLVLQNQLESVFFVTADLCRK